MPGAVSSPDLVGGRTFFVTGASSGIGRALVEALAAGGGRVVLATRSEQRTRPVLEAIQRRYPGADTQWVQLDVADLASVRRAAAGFLATGRPIDVLVNNAGIAGTRALSTDGFDLTYATNHMGPFLLTNLLLPRLREAPQGRIVNVASEAHRIVKQIDWSVLDRRTAPKRSAFKDYAVTKLMNVLHAQELARRLAGTRVTTYALHPGTVASNIWRALPRPVQWVGKLFMLSNAQGARTPFYCATAAEIATTSGRYYDRGHETRPSPLAEDATLGKELWERTEAAVSLDAIPRTDAPPP
ncbi:MAG TPA: SDR family NAD(P)-dependent oxidoreductase [Gemmatimonadales bacterium]|jgi:dehydrogenase/reductase SDR family protein 13|nr:SDR family NAD(P)-dependent oxidoreductase [Gemmatimonadales bacterium]